MAMAPACGIVVCIYVPMYVHICIIYPAFVASWFLRLVYALKYSVYSVYWRAHVHDLQLHLTEHKDDWSYLCLQ